MITAAADPKLAWYIARSAGLVSWALLSASMFWGLALSTRLVRRRGIPAWLLDLHRFLGGLSVLFTAIHLLGLVADNTVSFGLKELLVPFASSWRPVAVAWGVIALYLLVAVEVSSLLLRRLPRRWWRRIHTTSFGLFITATVHGVYSGSDRSNLLAQWAGLTITTVVAVAIGARLGTWRAGRRIAGAGAVRAGSPRGARAAAEAADPVDGAVTAA